METQIRLIVNAADIDGMREAFDVYTTNKHELPRTRYRAVCGTRGTTQFVRDYALYGTATRPIVQIGKPYETPDWMLK